MSGVISISSLFTGYQWSEEGANGTNVIHLPEGFNEIHF